MPVNGATERAVAYRRAIFARPTRVERKSWLLNALSASGRPSKRVRWARVSLRFNALLK